MLLWMGIGTERTRPAAAGPCHTPPGSHLGEEGMLEEGSRIPPLACSGPCGASLSVMKELVEEDFEGLMFQL